MDINTITSVRRPRSRAELWPFREGDAWVGGGTWLFSEPQPKLSRVNGGVKTGHGAEQKSATLARA